MATINVRIDDDIRDDLKDLADDAGVTLSEYVRTLVLEAVRPVAQAEVRHGDEPGPTSLSFMERKVLSMLHRILARVLPDDSNDVDGDSAYQLARATVLEQGFTGEYWVESAGFATELSSLDSRRVVDILQMFRILTYSIDELRRRGEAVDPTMASRLEFEGFDHNDAIEGHMAEYVSYLVDDEHWAELKPTLASNDGGNSHAQMLPVYLRMLSEFRQIMDGRARSARQGSYLLGIDELDLIAKSRVHPSRR